MRLTCGGREEIEMSDPRDFYPENVYVAYVLRRPPVSPRLHPLIEGLFGALPEPETRWVASNRVKWLRAAASCFALLYMGDGEVHVEIAPPEEPPHAR